ncbi:MAG: DMT family transporter [Rhodospirillaceae bacterium]|nr:DMT family transporter [Rhodospirillaceae bacterium]
MSETTRTRLYTFALLAILIYGVTPVFTKVGTLTADGVSVGALRAVVAAPVAALVIAITGCRIPLRRDAVFLVLVSGLGGLVLFPVFFSWGVQFTTTGHAAAGTAAGAVMAGAIMAVLNRQMPGWPWWIGVAVGSMGALLLIWEALGLSVEGVSWQGDALVFLGMFMGVVGYVAGSKLTAELGAVTVTMWSVLVAAAFLVPVVVFHSGVATLVAIDVPGWLAICSLAWGTTILAYLLWNRALADGGVTRIGALQLLQPIIGIGLAPVILGEPLTPTLLLATLVILAGVVLVQREPR